MADIESASWSETDASNNSASPNGWASGTMIPSQVEPTARGMMGALKRDWDHKGPTLTSGGAANVQTLTYSVAPTAYVQGQIFVFLPGFTNTGATTLNVNALGAKAVQLNGLALVGHELVSGGLIAIVGYDGTQFQLLNRVKKPTRQIFTSGSGTYTSPTTATMLRVRMTGGGGGGNGNGTAGPSSGATSGGNTTFGTFTAAGGVAGTGGAAGIVGAGGAGGATAGSPDISWTGGFGGSGNGFGTSASGQLGGIGGASIWGGQGTATNGNGISGSVNSGSGGGGASANSVTFSAGGGGAGGTADTVIINPAATYSYVVGAGGTGGVAGTSGATGGAGGSGIIIVEEFYN